MPDPDALLMAAGMAIDMNGDLPHGDALLYGRHVSPGTAFVVRAIYPLFFHDPRALVACLNWSTAILSAFTASTMYLLARRYLARAAAAGAAAIWIGNPVAWESGTYFHTVVPSTLLLLLAMVLAFRIERSRRGVAYYVATALCAIAAFLTRTEIVFAAPALVVWTLTSKRARRDTLLLASIAAVVLGAYACVLVAIAGESTVPSGGFHAYTNWYAASFSPRGLDRTAVWTVFSLGIASVAAVLLAIVRRRVAPRTSGHGRLVMFACAWVLPSVVFWMLTPVPILRHFYVATVGAAWLVGVVVLQDGRRATAVAAAIVALNLALPEAVYGAHRWRTGLRKMPHGTFFSAHAYWSQRVATFVALRERAGACMEASSSQSALAVTTWEVCRALDLPTRRVEPPRPSHHEGLDDAWHRPRALRFRRRSFADRPVHLLRGSRGPSARAHHDRRLPVATARASWSRSASARRSGCRVRPTPGSSSTDAVRRRTRKRTSRCFARPYSRLDTAPLIIEAWTTCF